MEHSNEPDEVATLPGLQGEQELMPLCSWNWPGEHSAHWLAPWPLAKLPREQGMHDASPLVGAICPGLQRTHAVALRLLWKLPGAHERQGCVFELVYFPSAHCWQKRFPCPIEYSPLEQFVHEVRPVAPPKEPGGQKGQLAVPKPEA